MIWSLIRPFRRNSAKTPNQFYLRELELELFKNPLPRDDILLRVKSIENSDDGLLGIWRVEDTY
jgi:hypothetical protein